MSDAPDLDEVDLESFVGAPPDWRDRLAAACRAAGVSPVLAGVAVATLVLAIGGVAVAFGLRGGGGPPVEQTLPFSRPPEVITTTSEPPPADIVVHVAGAVATPGVYRLRVDARVVDAVDAAGGPAATADIARVNLAAPLADGQQVYVVAVGESPPAPVAGAGAGNPTAEAGTPPLVDINQAGVSDLEALPGIGPALAAAIVSHREEHGPFVAVESLLDVSGIGEAKLAGLRDFATV